MAELTQGKIIIDARGTQKDVFKQKIPEPQVQVEAKPTLGEKILDAAVPVLAGAAAAEVVDLIQEKLHGAKENKEKFKTPEKEKELDFTQIEDRLFGDKNLESGEKKKLEVLRQERVDEFNKLDGGRFAEDLSISVRKTLRKNDWDDIYDELGQVGRTLEKEMRGRAEIPDHLNGIVLSAVRYESARVLKAGLVKQTRDIGPSNMKKWIKDKKADQYNDDELVKIDKLARRSFIRLAPDAPEELVGRDVKKEESFGTSQDSGQKFKEFEERMIKMFEAVATKNPAITLDMLREAMGQADPLEIKKLYRKAEKGMYPIPSGLEVPKFLIHNPELVELWDARARLSSACNFKRMAKDPDELSQNTEAQAISNEQLELLLRMPGVLEAKSLETYFIRIKKRVPVTEKDNKGNDVVVKDKDENVIKKLIDYPLEDLIKDSDNLKLKESCPENIFKISEGKHLEGFRQAKIYWLMKHRGFTQEQAEDAEVVSRNLTYLANEHEAGDTRYDNKGNYRTTLEHKFASPTVAMVKSLNAWQLIHMQERLQAKTETAKETWSPFGPWALRKYIANYRTKIDPKTGDTIPDPGWRVSSEKLLPIKLIPDAFEYNKDGSKKRRRFSEIFVENGEKLLTNPEIPYSELSFPNFGGEISEGLFAGYSFLALSPAITIFKIMTDPSKFDKNWNSLGNALSSCDVSLDMREKMLLGLYGVDPNKDKLVPLGGFGGKIEFAAYMSKVKEFAPNFWRIEHDD